MHGAATSPNAEVFACAAAQVKKALEVTHSLGGEGYTFWGGREGYSTLWNTDMKRELDHLGKFLHLAVDYAKEIGFKGQFYIEPKPKEPTKHQYDSDAAACLNFLREYDLLPYFKLNLETNHATLAGHSMQHEMEVAGAAGALGSIDANTGDLLVGWDTDQFPTDIYLTTQCMLVALKYGGFSTGGINFDSKVRRESVDPEDLFHAHIGGMDAFARGLKIAAAIRADGRLAAFVKERYQSWDSGLGARIEAGQRALASLERFALEKEEAAASGSGRQGILGELSSMNSFEVRTVKSGVDPVLIQQPHFGGHAGSRSVPPAPGAGIFVLAVPEGRRLSRRPGLDCFCRVRRGAVFHHGRIVARCLELLSCHKPSPLRCLCNMRGLGVTPVAPGATLSPRTMRAPKKKNVILSRSISTLLAAGILSVPVAIVKATSDVWDGSTNGLWATNTNWLTNPAIVPGTGDTATFSGTGNGFTTIDLGAGITIRGLLFDTAAAASYTIGAGVAGSQTLTWDNGGAVVVSAPVTTSQTVNANLVMGNDGSTQSFSVVNQSVAANQLLTLAGGITGSAGAGIKTRGGRSW